MKNININPNSVSSVNSVVKMFGHRDIETQSGMEPTKDNPHAFQIKIHACQVKT